MQPEPFIAQIDYVGIAGPVPSELDAAAAQLMRSKPLKPDELETYLRLANGMASERARSEFSRFHDGGPGALRLTMIFEGGLRVTDQGCAEVETTLAEPEPEILTEGEPAPPEPEPEVLAEAPSPWAQFEEPEPIYNEFEARAERQRSHAHVAQLIAEKPVRVPPARSRTRLNRALAAALALFAIGTGIYLAQPPAAEVGAASSTAYGGWRLNCGAASAAPTSCALSQDIADEKTRGLRARLSVEMHGASPVMALVVPHDVLLQPGLEVAVGGKAARTLPYDICNEFGCIAIMPMDTAEATFEGTGAGRLSFVHVGGMREDVPFSLNGLEQGMDAYRDVTLGRGAWWRRILPWSVS